MLVRAGITDELVVDIKDHPPLPDEHVTEQLRRLAQALPPAVRAGSTAVAAAGQWADPGPGCYLRVSEQQHLDLERWLGARGLDRDPLILIQAGNKRTMRRGLRRLAVNYKYWPSERWAAVIRHLRMERPACRIVLLGTVPEYALNAELIALAAVDRVHNAADDLPIPRLVALLARAAALLSVDSGPAHAAAAVGCPQVVLFGKASPSLYRPWGAQGADVRVLCGRVGGEASMLGIAAGEVVAAWRTLAPRI